MVHLSHVTSDISRESLAMEYISNGIEIQPSRVYIARQYSCVELQPS